MHFWTFVFLSKIRFFQRHFKPKWTILIKPVKEQTLEILANLKTEQIIIIIISSNLFMPV